MLLLAICSIIIFSGCESKVNNNAVISHNITTTVVAAKDQKYIEKISYSALLVNKSEEAMNIIEVQPIMNELMSSKLDVPATKIVNLFVPEEANMIIEDEFNLIPKSTTQEETIKEIFIGLNLKLDNGKIVYVAL
jgi:hypothetical protein